jgi:hypothetical protein
MPQHQMPPQPNQNMGMMPQQPQQMTIAQKYIAQTSKYVPALNPNNPHMKQQVGSCIYEYVGQLVGDEKAPKITGMLIELPINQIRDYMMDFGNLQAKVKEALEHWEKAQEGQIVQQ